MRHRRWRHRRERLPESQQTKAPFPALTPRCVTGDSAPPGLGVTDARSGLSVLHPPSDQSVTLVALSGCRGWPGRTEAGGLPSPC